jgi:hypothetical protein
MTHTQDLEMELTLIDLWPKMFPEQNGDVDGVKARILRQKQIVMELIKKPAQEKQE